MKKYEYKQISDKSVDLRSLGEDGWELCGIYGSSWIFKKEISGQDAHIRLLISCAYARGVANLQHRTIAEFAQFVEDVMSDKPNYQKYQFDWNSKDAIETWIVKFHEYYCELYDSLMKGMINDDSKSGENINRIKI